MVIQTDSRQQMNRKHHQVKERTWKIYKHTSPEGKSYIGRTSQTLKARSGTNGCQYKANEAFYADIKRFGWDAFSHEILQTCETEEESMRLEIEYIKRFDSTNPSLGYNKSVGGYPCNKGLTEEERKKRHADGIKRWQENNRERWLEYHRKYDRSENVTHRQTLETKDQRSGKSAQNTCESIERNTPTRSGK